MARRFEYSTPGSLEELRDLLGRAGGRARVLAGGTDLLVQVRNGVVWFPHLVGLKRIPELRGIRSRADGFLEIGAATTVAELHERQTVRRDYDVLAQAAGTLGSAQIRNLATVGGNICRASPSGDLAPALLVLDAGLIVVGRSGERREMPVERVFVGPGQTALAAEDVAVSIVLPPRPTGSAGIYLKHGRVRSMDLAVVGVAASLTLDCAGSGPVIKQARLALGAVGPTPLRAREAERLLEGEHPCEELIVQAGCLAAEEARPITDVRASAAYRREMISVLTRRCLANLLSRLQG